MTLGYEITRSLMKLLDTLTRYVEQRIEKEKT